MAPASLACSLMGIDLGSISNTGKNPVCCPQSAGFFSNGKTTMYMKWYPSVVRRQALIPFYLS